MTASGAAGETAFKGAYIMRHSVIPALGLCVLLLSGPVLADDAQANAIYDRMSKAYAEMDLALMDKVYAPGAVYVPTEKSFGVIKGREEILVGTKMTFEQVRKNGGKMQIDFRITDRQTFGDLAADAGYFRFTALKPDGTQGMVSYGKFVTMPAKQKDGSWAFASDMSGNATPEAWEKAKPFPGARFDK